MLLSRFEKGPLLGEKLIERRRRKLRQLFVTEFVTLDGVMEDPGGAEGFEHGGWSFQFWNDESAKFKFDELFASGAMLLGRVTYEGFAKAWPTMTDESGFADRMNNLPKYVVSRTLQEATWNNSTVISENVSEAVANLKAEEGQDIMVAGSRQLARSLLADGLVDEIRLLVSPVVLGSGRRLFDGIAAKQVLQLAGAESFETGAIVLTYRPVP
jgi:dihydrofolate reductase